MRAFLTAFFIVLIAVIASQVPALFSTKKPPSAEAAFDRVVKNNTLRCGYNFWEPGLVFDEQKQQLHGFYFDLMQEFEKESGIKIVWDHVVDWGQVKAELDGGRIDAMCAMWNTTHESRHMLFTKPFAYQFVVGVVRANDMRFDKDITAANAAGIKIAVVDNATQDFIAKSDFPLAMRNAMPPMASNAELLMDVQTGKSDITFTNPGIFEGYTKNNPGKLKMVGKPLRVYGNSLTLGHNEAKLANLLNVSFSHMIDTGKIDALVAKYNTTHPGTFIAPRKSFAE